MKDKQKHIVWVIANNSTAPYFNWFAELAAKKKPFHLSFICLFPEKPQMIVNMSQYGFTCHWIHYDCDKRKRNMLKVTWKLYFLLRRLKPDVINSHLFDDSLPSMLVGKLAGVKLRAVTKGDTGFHYRYTPKWMLFDKLINRWATHVVAISEECKQFIIEKEKADPEKVVVVHHGIPVQQYAQNNEDFVNRFQKKHQLENKFVVGTVARFIEWKGYKEIVQIAELLVPKIPNICFLLVGRGDQKEEIIQLIYDKKLEAHFCLPGYIQPENMPFVYGVMHTYLHAAKLEPFGFVIAEALAAGLPVVSTPTGAALDVIKTGENGWLGEYDNPASLANHLLTVYEKKPKLPWLPAQKTASKYYTTEIMFENYLKLYVLN